ncbi:protein FAM234A [Lepisosteus oculatus]|uniref:protein FAM234A n=1 Tax=Lepisosteus oculatus TaxID=7918 RepID=UPI0035F50CF6
MSDSASSVAEAQPLKAEEREGPPAPQKKQGGCRAGSGLSRLSHWRTAAFFLSLFLCLAIVFAFSFIIPCPVRAVSLRTWNRTFADAGAYNFLAIMDVNRDKVMDVVFAYKDSTGSLNTTCSDKNLSSPCVVLAAASGTNGSPLWERPLEAELRWAQCGVEGLGGPDTAGCLVSHSSFLTAVDQHRGQVLWTVPGPPGLDLQLPVLTAPDLDGDAVQDVVLIGVTQNMTKAIILSGKTGSGMGAEVVLEQEAVSGHLLHTTERGAPYVLLQTGSGVQGYALRTIAAQAEEGSETRLKTDSQWEAKAGPGGLVPVDRSSSVRYLTKAAQRSGVPHLLVVTAEQTRMIHGQSLETQWTVNASGVLSEPSFGYFSRDSRDETPDVVIEADVGHGMKKVLILDGSSGAVLWEETMVHRAGSPRPASVNTLSYNSVFVFWGAAARGNGTSASPKERFMYMLHPSQPDALLEKSSTPDPIAAFKAALFEKGRHACLVLLTGPEGQGAAGEVTLAKRKLKDDVPESRVLWLRGGGGPSRDQEVRDFFNNLRFKQDH